jgi:hypothetical protein
VSHWRDQVAAVGLDRTARALRDAGLALSRYRRGRMFPAPSPACGAGHDNRRAVDEALALGAPC